MFSRFKYASTWNNIPDCFQNVIDPLSVGMPWSWDLIDAGFNSMVDALPNIVENPKTTLSNLEGGILRYIQRYMFSLLTYA